MPEYSWIPHSIGWSALGLLLVSALVLLAVVCRRPVVKSAAEPELKMRAPTIFDYGANQTVTLPGVGRGTQFSAVSRFPSMAHVGDLVEFTPQPLPFDPDFELTLSSLKGLYLWSGFVWMSSSPSRR